MMTCVKARVSMARFRTLMHIKLDIIGLQDYNTYHWISWEMNGIWYGCPAIFPWFSYCVPQEKSEVLQAVHRSNPHVPGKTLFHVISVLVEV